MGQSCKVQAGKIYQVRAWVQILSQLRNLWLQLVAVIDVRTFWGAFDFEPRVCDVPATPSPELPIRIGGSRIGPTVSKHDT